MGRTFWVVGDSELPQFPEMPHDYRTRVFLLALAPESCRIARHCVRDLLETWRLGDLAEAAAMLTTELVSNAIRHASGWSDADLPVRLLLIYAARTLRIEVRDPDAQNLPLWRVPSDLSTFGYGVPLMNAYADRYGVRILGSGKAVWCEVDRKQDDTPFPRSDLTVERGTSHG